MDQELVYRKLRELRIEKGLSQKRLGERCGLTQQAINRIEQGQRKIDIDLLFKIASALNVDPFQEILSDNMLARSVFDVEDEALTNYIASLGYSITLLDEQHYILSKGNQKYKISHEIRGKLFTEIDDYTIYKLETIMKSIEN